MGYMAYNNLCYSYHVITIQILSQDVNELSILLLEARNLSGVVARNLSGL